MSKTLFLVRKYVMILGALALAFSGSYRYLARTISVSNNVNGRELPIYSVETDEKKIALSFDAAWGNDDTKQILDILIILVLLLIYFFLLLSYFT